MKKTIISFLFALWMPCVMMGATTDVEAMWERGNMLYSAGDYNGAMLTYDSIVNEGLRSAELFYNLGGACFKSGKNGQAILNYHRAQRLDPSNEDIAHNLAYAESFVKDKIDEISTGFFSRTTLFVRRMMSADAWGVLSLVALGFVLTAVGFYLLSQRRGVRKAGFIVALVSLVVLVVAISNGSAARRELLAEDEAVVLASASSVKASPERESKDLFVLHEGTKVEVLGSYGEWSEIRIADGNKGWILTSAVEII